MDSDSHHHRSRNLSTLYKRASRCTQALSQYFQASSLPPQIGVIVIGGILALISAWHAQDLAEELALSNWLEQEQPNLRTWVAAFQGRGLHPVSDLPTRHRLNRLVESFYDPHSSILVNPDRTWIAVHWDPTRMEPPRFFGPLFDRIIRSRDLPREWENIGKGWLGFQRILEEIDRTHPDGIPPIRTKKIRSYRDPREIHY